MADMKRQWLPMDVAPIEDTDLMMATLVDHSYQLSNTFVLKCLRRLRCLPRPSLHPVSMPFRCLTFYIYAQTTVLDGHRCYHNLIFSILFDWLVLFSTVQIQKIHHLHNQKCSPFSLPNNCNCIRLLINIYYLNIIIIYPFNFIIIFPG